VSHKDYIQQTGSFLAASLTGRTTSKMLDTHAREYLILLDLDLDPAEQILGRLYCPVKRAPPRNPIPTLRSLILMTLLKTTSITEWVNTLRTHPLHAVMAGFDPDDTPGIGTYYDFFHRLIDGPYRKPSDRMPRRSQSARCIHQRNFKKEKETRKQNRNHGSSLSENLVDNLLPLADQPLPDEFPKVLHDLLARVGIGSSIRNQLLTEKMNLAVAGDGSILKTAASPRGKPTCSCPRHRGSSCEHDRLYTSATANWCYDSYRDSYLFGDRYYHLIAPVGGHDLPLLTIMPGGNESDFTLSLKAFDRFLKVLRDHRIDLHPRFFCGDGHHDTSAHYRYFRDKQIVPVIPFGDKNNVILHLISNPDLQLTPEGFPLCPAGKLLRHHAFDKARNVHVFACPAKRNTHRFGKSVYVFHPQDCPRKIDCNPQSSLAPLVYIHADENPRLFPPIPRNTDHFKSIMNMRSATERCNAVIDSFHLDRSSRNADYGLIRLTLVNICQHAVAQYDERVKDTTREKLLHQTVEKISGVHHEDFRDTG